MTFALKKIGSHLKLFMEDVTDILCQIDLLSLKKEFCLTIGRSAKKLETDTLSMI